MRPFALEGIVYFFDFVRHVLNLKKMGKWGLSAGSHEQVVAEEEMPFQFLLLRNDETLAF